MSKKKFIDGLESLFTPSDEGFSEDSLLLVKEDKKKRRSSRKNRSSLGKTFTADLDSLFEEALKEDREEKQQRKSIDEWTLSTKKRIRKPLSGLDALIRGTLDSDEADEFRAALKRVSFTCDADKYKQLKEIAKKEKKYIKDILNNMMYEYIKEYNG